MVEFPRLNITKENFEKVIQYLRDVKWWGAEDNDTKKAYMISCMDIPCKKSLLALEGVENLTLRQIIGRLKLEFHEFCLEVEAKESGKKEEAIRIRRAILINQHEHNEGIGEYWARLEPVLTEMTFEGKIAVLSATCLKSVRRHVKWIYIKHNSSLKDELYLVDYNRNRRIYLNNKNKLKNNNADKEISSKKEEISEETKNSMNNMGYISKDNINNIIKDEIVNIIREEFKNIRDANGNTKISEDEKEATFKKKLKIKKTQKRNEKRSLDKINQARKKEEMEEVKREEWCEEFICENYKEITDMNLNTGLYPGEKCRIKTLEGKEVRAAECNIKKGMQDLVNIAIEDLLKKKYIARSTSTWNNMIRPVLKPDKSIRLCLNLMALNEITESDKHRLPNIDDILDTMQGNEYFSVLDLKEGYYQIELEPSDRYKTAFTINNKKYEWNVMPMGYKNAPAIFQRIMEQELREWLGSGCLVYLDDIVIYAKTLKEHNNILKGILKKLKEKNLKINSEKLQLCRKQVKLLGIIVDGETVMMPKEMKDKIFEFKLPKTKKDLQRFLGAINYHRRFIDNINDKTEILYEILKDEKTMNDWTDKHSEVFLKLQEEANKEVRRYHPNFERQFILETDASSTGLGALLYQKGDKNERMIIKPIATKLSKSEINWGITEKEVYAVVWAIEKLNMYLLGRKFHVITDHRAAQWIKTKQDFGNARIQRWIDKLQSYDFTIEYRSGDEMYEADALSRMYNIEEKVKTLPTEDQRKMIIDMHEEVGHRAVDVTEYAIKKQYTSWINMRQHIKDEIGNCETCIRNKAKNKGGSIFVESERKLEKVGVDILEYNENYILVAIDYYTRRIWATVLKSKAGIEISSVLTLWFKRFGNPETIIIDQGLEFCNSKVEEMCLRRDIKMRRIRTDHHQSC